MERDSYDLGERLLNYGARIIKVVEALPNTLVGRRVGDQLLRCGTSVGKNYENAQAAESKTDFIHKLQVSLKELRESLFWLRLIARAELLSPNLLTDIIDEANQLVLILSKAVATAKGTAKK